MGCGIALAVALQGKSVTLLDIKDRDDSTAGLTVARDRLASDLSLLTGEDTYQFNHPSVIDRIDFTREMAATMADADYVFESLPEDPDIKTAFLDRAAPHLPDEAIIASTTSSISLDTLDDRVANPGRLLITHWLNPAFILPLVEVARTERTDDAAVRDMVDLLERLGKTPVVCRDYPGFIGSRIQAAAMNEAIRIYADGVASVDEIDRALQHGVAPRMVVLGLLRFLDYGGVEILYQVNEYLKDELGPRFNHPPLLVEKIENDELGPATGRGFYEYADGDLEELQVELYRKLAMVVETLENSGSST